MKEKLIRILDDSFMKQYEKRGLLTAPHTADDLIAHGVMVLPCKVGDTVYKIFGGKVIEMRAVAIPMLISTLGAHLTVTAENGREAALTLELSDFGKTVFLTREEAEAHLPQPLKGE